MALRLKLVGSVAIVVLCLTSFSGSNAGGPSPTRRPVAVAGLIPAEIAEALSAATGIGVQSMAHAGSLGIVEALKTRSVDFGAVTSDAAYLAFTGRLDQATAPFETLRGITVLDLKTIHLMARKHAQVRSIGDLRGMNVSLGPPGTGTSLVSKLLLNAHGVTLTDIDEEYVTIPEAVKRLAAGQLDAAFMPMVAPAPEATAAARGGAQLFEIAGATVEQLRLSHPFLSRARIAERTYPGQEKAVHTIAVDLLLVSRADTDDVLVYDFLNAYFTALGRTTAVTDLSRAAGMSIPLHAGAARYYLERELSR
jgi:TRAP transporter TAXI family solute receptor